MNDLNFTSSQLNTKVASGKGTNVEAGQDNPTNTISKNSLSFQDSVPLTEPVSNQVVEQAHDILASGGVRFDQPTQAETDPYTAQAKQLLDELNVKLEIARNMWSDSFKQVAQEISLTEPNYLTSLTPDNLLEQNPTSKADVAETYAQSQKKLQAEKILGLSFKGLQKTLGLSRDVIFEFAYLSVAISSKILRQDHDQFVFKWGERLGLTGYFKKYLSPSTLDALNPA